MSAEGDEKQTFFVAQLKIGETRGLQRGAKYDDS